MRTWRVSEGRFDDKIQTEGSDSEISKIEESNEEKDGRNGTNEASSSAPFLTDARSSRSTTMKSTVPPTSLSLAIASSPFADDRPRM